MRGRRGIRALGLIAALSVTPGCGESPTTPMALFTLFDVPAFLALRAQGLAPDTLPTGVPAAAFAPASDGSAAFTINLAPNFTEGGIAAYVTTETWKGYPEVWMAPVYVLAQTDPAGKPTAIPGQPPIFSVGPHSAFYSPYWKVTFAVVPAGDDPSTYRTTRQIFAAKLPLVPGPGRLISLGPPGMDLTGYARAPANLPPPHPYLPQVGTSTVARGQGVIDGDGTLVDTLDFGVDRFTWNSGWVVDEAPIVILRARDATGTLVPTGLPTIGGTGPFFTNTPARISKGRPSFGSLWRMAFAELPLGAGALIPDSLPDAEAKRTRLAQLGLVGEPAVPAPWSTTMDVSPFFLRPVLNAAACFAAPLPTDPACQWIDSQAALEKHLASSLRTTDTLVTCPFVTYAGKAVP